jgi:NADH-quinone oxidoreductase E subunit
MSTQATDVLSEEIVGHIRDCMGRPYSESYLIAVLQRVQETYGYLSKERMDAVSQLMQVPAAKVSGVATFYHFFNFKPKGEHRITVCMGTACFVRGADRVLERLKEMLGVEEGETTPDGRFSVECARCLGACALAPVVLVNERVHGNVKPEQVEGLLKTYGHKRG